MEGDSPSSDAEHCRGQPRQGLAMQLSRFFAAGLLFVAAACVCALAAGAGRRGAGPLLAGASYVSAAASGDASCPTAPQLDGERVSSLIEGSSGLLVIGMPNMRCTLAVRSQAEAAGVAHIFHQFSGQFQYESGLSDIWDYLHCKYPDDRQSGTIMHSYVFKDGEFVGQGFAAAEKLASGALAAPQDGSLRRLPRGGR